MYVLFFFLQGSKGLELGGDADVEGEGDGRERIMFLHGDKEEKNEQADTLHILFSASIFLLNILNPPN